MKCRELKDGFFFATSEIKSVLLTVVVIKEIKILISFSNFKDIKREE